MMRDESEDISKHQIFNNPTHQTKAFGVNLNAMWSFKRFNLGNKGIGLYFRKILQE